MNLVLYVENILFSMRENVNVDVPGPPAPDTQATTLNLALHSY